MTAVKPDDQRSVLTISGERSNTPTKQPPRAADTKRAERQMAVWCPDWPVVAAAVQLGLSLQLPLAVFELGCRYGETPAYAAPK